MTILIISVVLGLCFAGGMFGLVKFFQSRQRNSVGKDVQALERQIKKYDESIRVGLEHTANMVPFEDARGRKKEIRDLEKQLKDEREKLEKLDKQVRQLQTSVEHAEVSHNELKKGKEDAGQLAAEIEANKAQLAAEHQRLQSELDQSLAQLTALSSELNLTSEQEIAVQKIYQSLERTREQMNTLAEIHTQAANRFVNLESQYQELEKEFTKLVEKELGN